MDSHTNATLDQLLNKMNETQQIIKLMNMQLNQMAATIDRIEGKIDKKNG